MKFSTLALVGSAHAMSKVQVAELLGGFVEGALKEEALGDYITCTVVDGQIVEQDLKTAVADLETKTVAGVVNGIDEVASALTTITGAYKLCTSEKDVAQLQKVESMLESLKNPVTLVTDIYHNLKVNGKDITTHIDAAADDWHAEKYHEFGMDLGFAVAETTLGKQEIEAEALRETNLQVAADIAYGLLLGAVKAEGLENMETCFSGPAQIIETAEQAIADFKAGGVDNVVHGLKELAVLTTQLKQEVAACKGVKADWQKLEEMAAVMSNPTSFAYHVGKDLLLNGHDIYNDINAGISEYKAQQWEPFGESVGHALAKLILGEEPTEQAPDFLI